MNTNGSSKNRPYINQQLVQIGILVGTLGIILCLIGLYPGITGLEPKEGIGILQIMIIVTGMSLIVIGAFIFVKVGFYPGVGTNLPQRIAIRLSFTGILFTAACGFSDVLGYGSNPPGSSPDDFPILGHYQAIGMVVGFVIASLGILLYAVAGPPLPLPEKEPDPLEEFRRKTQEIQQLSGESQP